MGNTLSIVTWCVTLAAFVSLCFGGAQNISKKTLQLYLLSFALNVPLNFNIGFIIAYAIGMVLLLSLMSCFSETATHYLKCLCFCFPCCRGGNSGKESSIDPNDPKINNPSAAGSSGNGNMYESSRRNGLCSRLCSGPKWYETYNPKLDKFPLHWLLLPPIALGLPVLLLFVVPGGINTCTPETYPEAAYQCTTVMLHTASDFMLPLAFLPQVVLIHAVTHGKDKKQVSNNVRLFMFLMFASYVLATIRNVMNVLSSQNSSVSGDQISLNVLSQPLVRLITQAVTAFITGGSNCTSMIACCCGYKPDEWQPNPEDNGANNTGGGAGSTEIPAPPASNGAGLGVAAAAGAGAGAAAVGTTSKTAVHAPNQADLAADNWLDTEIPNGQQERLGSETIGMTTAAAGAAAEEETEPKKGRFGGLFGGGKKKKEATNAEQNNNPAEPQPFVPHVAVVQQPSPSPQSATFHNHAYGTAAPQQQQQYHQEQHYQDPTPGWLGEGNATAATPGAAPPTAAAPTNDLDWLNG